MFSWVTTSAWRWRATPATCPAPGSQLRGSIQGTWVVRVRGERLWIVFITIFVISSFCSLSALFLSCSAIFLTFLFDCFLLSYGQFILDIIKYLVAGQMLKDSRLQLLRNEARYLNTSSSYRLIKDKATQYS